MFSRLPVPPRGLFTAALRPPAGLAAMTRLSRAADEFAAPGRRLAALTGPYRRLARSTSALSRAVSPLSDLPASR